VKFNLNYVTFLEGIMKKVLVLLVVLTALSAQDLKLRGIFINEDVNYFGAGIDYKFSEINDMPLFGTANFMYGSESSVSQSIFEVGGTLRKQLSEQFYLKGGTLISHSSISTEIRGVDHSITSTKLTLLVGAGFLINKQFSVVLDYGLTGADVLRFQLGFDL